MALAIGIGKMAGTANANAFIAEVWHLFYFKDISISPNLSNFLQSNPQPNQNPNRKFRPWEKLSYVRPSDSHYTIHRSRCSSRPQSI